MLTCMFSSALLCSSALAIPARPASWVLVKADLPVVADGVLLFHFDRGDFASGSIALQPTVTDDLGVIVPGAVETLDVSADHVIYRFDSALAAGRSFTVNDANGLSLASFTAGGPFVADVPSAAL